jgi:IQ calmodulin-binding motif/Regulatory subunit of type II PKA R-subunit
MNYLLHRQKSPGHIVEVPEGLPELMADISREVLREQPADILGFVADYLEAMLMTRENTVVAQATVDKVLNQGMQTVDLLTTVGIDREQADRAATIIQSAFTKHFTSQTVEVFNEAQLMSRLVEECQLTQQQARKVAHVIRAGYKDHYYQRRPSKLQLGSEKIWKQAAHNTLSIYAKAGPTVAEMNRAAVTIQAAYKGYFIRRERRKHESSAAITIQAAFRGYRARKNLTFVKADD